ncbi:MAG: transporter substrate-binding domain-containing protein [Oleiphilaceae bacterium]|nr:transporter substrate-binding domain-containing protein [Oleiphilaceae bacterium]
MTPYIFKNPVLFLMLLLALPAAAIEPEVDTEGATPRPTATFAIPDVPPWGFESSEGKPAGVLVTLTERLSRITRIPVDFQLRPYRRAIAELRAGDADFLMLFDTPGLEAPGIRVGTVLESQILLITQAGKDTPADLEALAGQSVGYIAGTHYGEAFEQADHFEKVSVNNPRHGLDMLRRGRISALISFDEVVTNIMDSPEFTEYDFNIRTISSNVKGQLYMSREFPHTEYLPIFSKALEHMRRNGEIRDIIEEAKRSM